MKVAFAPARTRHRAHGYSLIELMIVVVIVGILAAVAIPSFISYLRKSKASETHAFLAVIKQRQSAYFAEMGQYCNVDTPIPTTMPEGGDSGAWTATANWTQLGASPDTPSVYFQYNTYAGGPGTTPADHASGDFDDARGYTGTDFWFVSRAIGDLDGDGDLVTFESYSANTRIWVSDDKGWE